MKVYIFGNGNISFEDFEKHYVRTINNLLIDKTVEFIICEFRGLDTLVMEYLKTKSANVTIIHIGERPRYMPDKYKTKVSQWKVIGNFEDDTSRDDFAINNCTHFIAVDSNSNEKRKSGTQRNIEHCLALGKVQVNT